MMKSANVSVHRRLLVLGSMLALGGCTAGFQEPSSPAATDAHGRGQASDLAVLTYRAVDRLVNSTPQLTRTVPVIVSSLTDSQRIDQSSLFGTFIADIVKSRLAQRGMTVSEQRLRSAMLSKQDEGEMMLTRDSRAAVPGPHYSCVLTGTYAAAGSKVYVALKLVSASDARIISAVDFVVWRDDDVARLLGDVFPSASDRLS